jgi:hypothetical protein
LRQGSQQEPRAKRDLTLRSPDDEVVCVSIGRHDSATLGKARANALQVKASQGAEADAARTRALNAYKDFLTLWKDADPDIPILKQAKAEFAKLQ